MIPAALTIAGSDPSGGAGIQADLKTFSALKVYGMAVIAALTAQNTTGVQAVMDVPAGFVASQLDSVLSDIPPGAVKTGMLANASTIEGVARKLVHYGVSNLVVDPVMMSTSGAALLSADAIGVLRRQLLPLALIVTPNLAEARTLSGCRIESVDDMEEAALRIHEFGPRYVYLKGGHLDGPPVDVLFDGTDFKRLHADRIDMADAHGTGCVLSAAMAAFLARGESVEACVRLSKDFVTSAIQHGLRLGKGSGPCDPLGIPRR